MNYRKLTAALWLCLTCSGIVFAAPEKHVRVIVDTSISMRGTRTEPANDPSGLALISTTMLYDLARYELGPDGTFKVRTFDAGPGGGCPDSVPRSSNSEWLSPGRAASRDTFVNALLQVRYDAPCTFFFPYIESAAKDLESERSGHDVKRVIILITDGLTETKTQDEESRLLRELASRLQPAGIELYVLAFGQSAQTNESFFRGIFRFNESGGVTGNIFTDPAGKQIVETMVKIFETCFAYQTEVVSGASLDLAAGSEQRHVAVLARYDPPKNPAFKIAAPKGTAAGVSIKGPLAHATGREVPDARPAGAARPISYGVLWVVGPALGAHAFDEGGRAPSQIAILRPRNLRLELGAFGDAPADVAMVDAPMRLRVLVRPADGGPGDPGAVNIDYRVFAVRDAQTQGGYEYIPSEDWVPAVSGGGRFISGQGREFEIQPAFASSSAFRKTPANQKYFDGYVEVRAQIDGTTVATMPSQHTVRVYPRLAVVPEPSQVQLTHAGAGTLRAGQDGCADFMLRAPEGELRNSDYSLSASLDDNALKQGLSGSTVYLNGIELGAWEHGRRLSRDRILGTAFRTCLVVPRYTAGGEGFSVPIRFRLWQADDDPYRQLDAVRPLTVLVNIETAGVLQRYGQLFSIAFLLLLLLLLWLLASRLGMPADFQVALADGPDLSHAASVKPGDSSVWSRLLTRRARMAIRSLSGDRVIGTIVPASEDLYAFRPAPGYFELSQAAGADQWQMVSQQGDGDFQVSAHRIYRIKGTDQSVHYFRCQYERPAAPAARSRHGVENNSQG